MRNPAQCRVVLEGSGEQLCCPPVEYIKSWSPEKMYKSLEDERDDGTHVITIPRDFDKTVAEAFFKYIYTQGDMVLVSVMCFKPTSLPRSSSASAIGNMQDADSPASTWPQSDRGQTCSMLVVGQAFLTFGLEDGGLYKFKGLIFCNRCGSRSATKLVNLSGPCEPPGSHGKANYFTSHFQW